MSTTQEHLPITDIRDDIMLLKTGDAALVLETNAVNFGLLSDKEQIAIIDSFAQMLNSLSFSIEIVIHSQRLDISSYITLLDTVKQAQTNPLLTELISKYRNFIQQTVKENEVLDKDFYVVIHASSLEIGIGLSNIDNRIQKIKALLYPRRDQVVRQLARIGLKSTQLTAEQLVKLFYSIYNQQEEIPEFAPIEVQPVTLANPQSTKAPIQSQQAQPVIQPQIIPQTELQLNSQPPQNNPRNHPFIVEELSDNT